MRLAADRDDPLVGRHLRVGWGALLLFGSLGLVLETLHGLKVRALVDVSSETRRLMWTLAHAHGTLLGLVNIAFAATLRLTSAPASSRLALASACLTAALVAIPLGFFLGGLFAYAGDPGIGILLVPVGAVALLTSCVLVLDGLRRTSRTRGRVQTTIRPRSSDAAR